MGHGIEGGPVGRMDFRGGLLVLAAHLLLLSAEGEIADENAHF